MNKIETYKDLVAEERRLEELLQAQKELLTFDVNILKGHLHPVGATLGMLKKAVTPDRSNPLINSGIKKLINLFVKKVLLSRAGWVTKLTVPLILKNYTSHIVADRKQKWINKLFSWIGPKNHNGKAAPGTTVVENTEPY